MAMVKSIISILFLIFGLYYMYKLANLIEKNKEKIDTLFSNDKNKLSYPEESLLFFKYLVIFIVSMSIFSHLI